MNVHEVIGTPATLEQCAEEANELAQACLKLARIMRNENPTPVTEDEAIRNLNEEIGDVLVCMNALIEAGILSYEAIDSVYMEKENRWINRLTMKY